MTLETDKYKEHPPTPNSIILKQIVYVNKESYKLSYQLSKVFLG